MAPDSFQSDLFLSDQPADEPVFRVSLRDGLITEQSRFDGRSRTVEYPTPYSSGTGGCRLLEPGQTGSAYWCAIGLYCWTWLGAAPRDPTMTTFDSFTHARLTGGEYLGTAVLNGTRCSVIAWESDAKDERFLQVFYINEDDLLIGMDQFASVGSETPALQRRRRFAIVDAKIGSHDARSSHPP